MTVRIIKKPSKIENEIKLKDESLWCWHGEIPSETCDKIIKSADDNWDNTHVEGVQMENMIKKLGQQMFILQMMNGFIIY